MLKEAGLSVVNLPDEPEALVSLDVLKPEVVIVDEASKESFELCSQLYSPFHIPVILLDQNCRGSACKGLVAQVDNSVKQGAPLGVRNNFFRLGPKGMRAVFKKPQVNSGEK